MNNLKQVTIGLIYVAILGGCAHRTPTELTHISGLQAHKSIQDMDDIRMTAIKETAATLGAQSGLAWRAKQINQRTLQHDLSLSNIFNFRSLMLKHNVLPPVLSTADNIVNIGNDSVIRAAEKMYTITAPPHFVSATPSWQNYLIMHYTKPETPNMTLLPKTKAETIVWNQYTIKSWHYGVEQANNIFGANLARLKRDYQGMILYRKLLAQHMVTEPYIAETTLGVTGNQKSLRLNDRIMRIAGTANLITDTDTWQPSLKNLKSKPHDTKP
jgi:defect in organelle trafficking protein DotC